ncbi:serine/threonine-protein kinase [Parerythrobacter jejuensis]|uniref:Uncharacterized protein n=1 Tax=Parerythrobacter jejuensis TaxID=795812 RepID=A0A845AVX9_9SPHN|nr:hypothetical protein [Parerythrobacter jejuensis]MXP30573.1 hypothetical protein [Parerythrobacter jejuensis]MXP33333.1 hypothetical protein [Parerythrobacter jejuensis]
MSIAPPNASILPFHVQQIPASSGRDPGQQGKQETQGFGDILKTLQEDGTDADGKPLTEDRMQEITAALQDLERGIELESARHRYTLQVHVGDRALAFNARPLVGPAAAEFSSTLVADGVQGTAALAAGPAAGQQAGQTIAALDGVSVEPDFMLNATDERHAAARFARSATVAANTTAIPTSRAVPAGPSQQSAPQQATQRVADNTRALDPARPAEAARSPAMSLPMQARAQLFAQLVAAASEYRVAVRGAQLSQADNDRLIADIRAALRSYGLADLPISLSASAGDA